MERHEETIINNEIERVLKVFMHAVECVPRVCEFNFHIVIGKNYVAFVSNEGEVRAIHDGSVFAEAKTANYKLLTDAWDMFVLKGRGQTVYSPRLAVDGKLFTTDELVDLVRRGFRVLLGIANWV
jgi:hypothetical protein